LTHFKRFVLGTLRRFDRYPLWPLIHLILRALKLFTKNKFFTPKPVVMTRINSWIPTFSDLEKPTNSPIDLLFVVTEKDFEVLPLAIEGGLHALSRHVVGSIVIVTPKRYLSQLESILPPDVPNLELFGDEEVLGENLIQDLRSAFGPRAGWLIQQIIKVEMILSSKKIATLLIDADTVLTKDRIWLDEFGIQILCPSEEFNPSYYDALRKIGLQPNENYSFISHHMLIQTNVLREFFEQVGLLDTYALVKYVIENHSNQTLSPISLDYELYAQYMLSAHLDLVKIQKWSNIGVSRDQVEGEQKMKDLIVTNSKKYASVSLHSWM
jgi:hypothetical protein